MAGSPCLALRSRGSIWPQQRLARRRGPALALLVGFGVAIKRAFEIAQRDDEAGPAVAIAALEQEMLDECPAPVGERAGHGGLSARKLVGSERGIPVHLADDLLQIAERKLPDFGIQLPHPPWRQELVAFMYRILTVSHRAFAEELRLSKVGIPARAPNPAAHHVIAPRHQIGVVGRRGREERQYRVARLCRAALIGIETENPVVPACRDRLIAQVAEAAKRNLHDTRAHALRDLARLVAAAGVDDDDLVRP